MHECLRHFYMFSSILVSLQYHEPTRSSICEKSKSINMCPPHSVSENHGYHWVIILFSAYFEDSVSVMQTVRYPFPAEKNDVCIFPVSTFTASKNPSMYVDFILFHLRYSCIKPKNGNISGLFFCTSLLKVSGSPHLPPPDILP